MNLVSAGDLRRFWSRHCYESAQLLRFLPKSDCSLIDLGSGAGFPGLVLSILRPQLSVTLIESNQKKASFLTHVSRETCSKVCVIAERVESRAHETDIVVTRALSSIDKTLGLLAGWKIGERTRRTGGTDINADINTDINNLGQLPRALLLKGSRWQDEMTEARRHWKISACVEHLQENFSDRTLNKVVRIWEWSAKRANRAKGANKARGTNKANRANRTSRQSKTIRNEDRVKG